MTVLITLECFAGRESVLVEKRRMKIEWGILRYSNDPGMSTCA